VKRWGIGLRRMAAVAVAAVVVAALAAGASAAPAGGPVTGTAKNGVYLALGDSVAFGYVPSQAVPAPNYHVQHSFVGYPEDLAQQLGERVFNASCPGETTASMLDVNAQSNGCENSVGSSTGYRDLYPLHVQYQGSQEAYALSFLAHHKNTQLVTIDIGANDAFVCQETTTDQCSSTAELTQLAVQIGTNLATIFGEIRGAGYEGPLVALSYYSLDYADPAQVAAAQFLNSVIAGAGAPYGVIVADGFGAFGTASAGFGGDPCAAGLLIKLPDGTCNIHPSAEGHEVLAQAIATAIGA
jgi:lysophospholipase L1-like esterase